MVSSPSIPGINLLKITAAPIQCHKGAAEGYVYLLKEGLLFLTKVKTQNHTHLIGNQVKSRDPTTGHPRHAMGSRR